MKEKIINVINQIVKQFYIKYKKAMDEWDYAELNIIKLYIKIIKPPIIIIIGTITYITIITTLSPIILIYDIIEIITEIAKKIFKKRNK